MSAVILCAVLTCPLKTLTDKMASENSSVSQDEKTALIETDSEQDVQQQCDTVAKLCESKLTLYHWTQSFNSQKVSVFTIQHHGAVDSSPSHVESDISEMLSEDVQTSELSVDTAFIL